MSGILSFIPLSFTFITAIYRIWSEETELFLEGDKVKNTMSISSHFFSPSSLYVEKDCIQNRSKRIVRMLLFGMRPIPVIRLDVNTHHEMTSNYIASNKRNQKVRWIMMMMEETKKTKFHVPIDRRANLFNRIDLSFVIDDERLLKAYSFDRKWTTDSPTEIIETREIDMDFSSRSSTNVKWCVKTRSPCVWSETKSNP